MDPLSSLVNTPLAVPAANSVDLLVQILDQNPIWNDLVTGFSQVMDLNVNSLIKELERVRFITQDSDPDIVKRTARMFGFSSSQDVLNLNSESLTRLVSQLPLYPDKNSTKYFSNFIDVLLNSSITIEYLYTRDYVNFFLTPGGPLVIDGGAWFKSTHVELNVSLLGLASLVLAPGQSLVGRVEALFYEYSPIPLVIKRLKLGVVTQNANIGFAAKLYGGTAYVRI